MSHQYKLIYFNARERGEYIRYIFEQAGVKYDQQVIQFDEWPKYKKEMPLGTVPVLEFDGKKLGQSTSIARFLANKFNLNGKNEWDAAFSDMLVQCFEDLNSALNPVVLAIVANDEKLKMEEYNKYKEKALKPMLDRFENFLGDKKFFCGDYFTYADLTVAELIDRMETLFDPNLTSCYPKLKGLHCRVHELPNIKKYIQTRPKYFL